MQFLLIPGYKRKRQKTVTISCIEYGEKLCEKDFLITSLLKIQEHTFVETSSLFKLKINGKHSKHGECHIRQLHLNTYNTV